ncbi:MAG: acetoacetyl-CoA synthetase [Cycloclasticus sp. symbiont of Bathymodiolus heckerae]|nr:MAG: acetoacetyl-CoA synthetase [Cycloclasticus sp. symbiont of Bathymodiolus heckerae]
MNKQLWTPSQTRIESSQVWQFAQSINSRYQLSINSYAELYDWSVDDIPAFWQNIWETNDVIHSQPYTNIVDNIHKMPGATWFAGSRLNYAENLLRFRDDRIAIHFRGEDQIQSQYSYCELYDKVEKLTHSLRKMGVTKGDRVAAFMPNVPETVIGMLATASIGAIWSSTSPDFGIKGVLDRFQQINPKVVIATDGYLYGGKYISTLDKLASVIDSLPSVEKVIVAKYVEKPTLDSIKHAVFWDDFLASNPEPLKFEQLPFDHPLYIMYSSGTTGLPKSIVHCVGGVLLQHLKEHKLHVDMSRDKTLFYFTTCGWMMWNWLVSGLATGGTIVLFDGNPLKPDASFLLKMIDELNINIFGTSAKYIDTLESMGITPKQQSSYPSLDTILSTGSPLLEKSFDYVYNDWKEDVLLASISGGTDIVSCFAGGVPWLPVKRGELQCRMLGMKVEAFDETAKPAIGKQGELVCSAAFPVMPIYFLNDEGGQKYHDAYFDVYDNIWCHGDYIDINADGGVRFFGRSDATLNPGGVRLGTADLYRVVEALPEISDSVAVGQQWEGDERILLFVQLQDKATLTNELILTIKKAIKERCSPRHVPALILQTPEIPYTHNGKKVEVAIKKLIHKQAVNNTEALANPKSLDYYKNLNF